MFELQANCDKNMIFRDELNIVNTKYYKYRIIRNTKLLIQQNEPFSMINS